MCMEYEAVSFMEHLSTQQQYRPLVPRPSIQQFLRLGKATERAEIGSPRAVRQDQAKSS